MGSARNDSLSEQKKKHFSDPENCPHYLLGFCPHEIFYNDLGKPLANSPLPYCPKLHLQVSKTNYEQYCRECFSDDKENRYEKKMKEDLLDKLEEIRAEKMNDIEREERKLKERIAFKKRQLEEAGITFEKEKDDVKREENRIKQEKID